jgi:hypothetical protein
MADFLIWRRSDGGFANQFLLSPSSSFYNKPTSKADTVDTRMFCATCAGTKTAWTQLYSNRSAAWTHDAGHQRVIAKASRYGTRPDLDPIGRVKATLCWAIRENISINQLCSWYIADAGSAAAADWDEGSNSVLLDEWL